MLHEKIITLVFAFLLVNNSFAQNKLSSQNQFQLETVKPSKMANENEFLVKSGIETVDGSTFKIGKNVLNIKQSKEDELGGRIVGYLPTWAGSVADIQMDKLTHIYYSFLLPNANGTLKPIENSVKLEQLVIEAHKNNVKVCIAIGGWNDGDDSAFETIAADSALTVTFVSNVMDFIHNYNLDGVDMDWEYPESGASASNFVSMMTVFADSLHAADMLLTAAVIGKEWDANSIKDSVFSLVDWLNIMAYDNYSAANHSTYEFAKQCLDYWQNKRNLPKEKTVLGVPFYGYKPYMSYRLIVEQYPEAPDTDNVGTYFYNGKNTIYRKTKMAKERCSGTMIWEISQDTYEQNTSLLTVIYQTYLGEYVSLKNVEESELLIYPNPTTNSLRINLPLDFNTQTVEVVDQIGRLIKTISVENKASEAIIDVESLVSGIYLIKLDNESKSKVAKFIKR